MRCLSCNTELSDDEAVRKYDNWEEEKMPNPYIDLCNHCLSQSDLSSRFDSEEDFLMVQDEHEEDDE